MSEAAVVRAQLFEYALSLPEAYLDHPWGEDVAKVNRKVFVFFGIPPEPDAGGGSITIKVPGSFDDVMSVPGAEPAGYGLGKSGWVTVPLGKGKVSSNVLRGWIADSYRTIAPRRPAARLLTDAPG